MAIKRLTLEDIGEPVNIGGVRRLSLEDLNKPVDTGGIRRLSSEDLLEPSPVTPTTSEPTIEPTLPATGLLGIPYSLTPSIEEVSKIETDPFFRREMVTSFMETMDGLESLRQQPREQIRGAADFILSIPGFLTGVGVAAQRGSKNLLDQIVLRQQFDLEEWWDTMGKGLAETMEFFEPAKELMLGKPTPESQLVGAVIMAPVTALSKAGRDVSEWPRFEDYPTIKGIAKIVGDVGGFLAWGAILHKGIRTDVAKKAESIVAKAQEIKVKEELVDQVDDATLQRAQVRILEIQKAQLELEAEALKKEIEKGVDLDPPLKQDLKEKGEKVRKAKEEVEPIVEAREELKKHAEEISRDQFVAAELKGVEALLKDKEKPKGPVLTPEEIDALMDRPEEPTIELDREVGTVTEDPVSGEASPFFQTKEEAQAFKGIYKGRKSVTEDVEIFTQKLINDVNLAYHGEDIPIESVRDSLSQLAARADELRVDFTLGSPEASAADFQAWKQNVSEAAEWARNLRFGVERRGTTLSMMIPLDQIPGAVFDFAIKFKKIFSKDDPSKPRNIGELYRNKELFDKTGFWLGRDGNWRYEISDRKANLKGRLISEGIHSLDNLLDHPKLYAEFPPTDTFQALHNVKVEIDPNMHRGVGHYSPSQDSITIGGEGGRISKDTLLHEIQHRINRTVSSSFPGTSVEHQAWLSNMKEIIKRVDMVSKHAREEGTRNLAAQELHHLKGQLSMNTGDWSNVQWFREDLIPFIKETESEALYRDVSFPMQFSGKEGYRADPGEMEARVTEARENLTSEEREAIPPWETLDKLLRIEGIEAGTGVKLYTGIPLDEAVKLIGNVKKVLDRATLETLRASGWKWRQATLEQAPDLGNRPHKMWRMIEPTPGRKNPVILEPPKKGFILRTGPPLDEAGKAIVAGAKKFKGYVERATGLKKVKVGDAARALSEEFKRSFVDRSGNIRLELLDKLGDEGYKVVQKMYLTKGANSLAANMLHQMRKEVYNGISKSEKLVLDKLILADRMVAIGKTEAGLKFNYPEGLTPAESAAYSELFPQLEKLPPNRAQLIRDRAKAHFEWMKIPLRDMLEAELISKEEFDLLEKHNYRKIKLVDIFDKRYTTKLGKKKRTVFDSGVEALAKGRTTDVFEPSSEIMALEVFNRAYGRVLNNEANKSLLAVARNDPQNPFVRVREQGRNVPSGWQRIFVYEKGERKPIYLSPEMAKEWITNNPEISYRTGQFLRYASASPVLRTFATGINWGFALANLPRDVMHTWFAARMFSDGKWSGVYSPHLPIFLPQIGVDLARVFTDAATKGPRYQEYIKEGGGMEFLVHQGRLFQRGRRLEGSVDKVMDYLGYFGETSEIMTRLAIRDRVIRKRARQQGLTMEEARKNKEITREATFAARDYMDFGQGGGITKAADNALPYLNAAAQGTRGLWRAAVDDPRIFAYKVAQLGAVTTLVYAMMKENAPKTAANLQGSEVMENNLIIPLGDNFGFVDERGQTRYPYLKIPLDPGQKFFNTFFQASYDKWKGNEVDIDRVVESLKNTSPVGISNLPPTFSGFVGYTTNTDFWRNEDIWKKTKPFKFPRSGEESIPGRTPQAYTDLLTIQTEEGRRGLSPARAQFAVEELTTSGTMWSYLAGKGYEKLFVDVPQEKKEQHIAMTLSKVPVVKRFFGITNPYSKFAGKIEKAQEKDTIERFIQNRELDRLTEGHLFEKSVERKEVFKYINSFKEKDIRDRLTERFDYQYAIRKLSERSFWLRLKGLNVEPRAQVYYDRWKSADQEERTQIAREASIIGGAGQVLTNSFWNEFSRIRIANENIE